MYALGISMGNKDYPLWMLFTNFFKERVQWSLKWKVDRNIQRLCFVSD